MKREDIPKRTSAPFPFKRDGIKRGPQWTLPECCELMGIHYQQFVKWGKKYPGQPQPTLMKQRTASTYAQALYDKQAVIRWIKECLEAEKEN